jgi:hypothetical protein
MDWCDGFGEIRKAQGAYFNSQKGNKPVAGTYNNWNG